MSTGFVFDEIYTKHTMEGHPENHNRLLAILTYLMEHEILPQAVPITARPATFPELSRCHHSRYIKTAKDVCQNGGGMLDPDTYTNQYSFEAATMAAGGIIELVYAVLNGEVDNGFALVRPPGHHALKNRAMGFCLFGNIAVAAQAARYEKGLSRVAIVDFDVHHGNGTQAILDDVADVLFISSHQHPFYPGTGSMNEIGKGVAAGTKINLPLSPRTGDESFKQLYNEIVFPALRRFQPELLLISAGFDAHWKDPLANLGLSLAGYAWICENLHQLAAELCDGRIVFVLEGGYNLSVLAPGVGNTFRILMGDTERDDALGASHWSEPDVSELVAKLKQLHKL